MEIVPVSFGVGRRTIPLMEIGAFSLALTALAISFQWIFSASSPHSVLRRRPSPEHLAPEILRKCSVRMVAHSTCPRPKLNVQAVSDRPKWHSTFPGAGTMTRRAVLSVIVLDLDEGGDITHHRLP